MPGQIFTHRNIAKYVSFVFFPVARSQRRSLVQLNDPNGISALTYAVAELGVEHVIVGGHTNCGGAAVCLDHAPDKHHAFNVPKESYAHTDPRETASWPPPPPLNTWLQPLRDLALRSHAPTVRDLVILNVKEQVQNVASSEVVKSHWAGTGRGSLIGVHGWLYELETGMLQDLNCSIWGPNGPGPRG